MLYLLQVYVLLVGEKCYLIAVVILPLFVLVSEEDDGFENGLGRGEFLGEAVFYQMVEVVIAEGHYAVSVAVDLLRV